MLKRMIIGSLAAVCLFILAACNGGDDYRRVDEISWAMDTMPSISIFYRGPDNDRTQQRYRDIARQALSIVDEVELIFSMHIEGTDVWRINNAGGAAVEVHPYVIYVLEEALRLRELTGGVFDVTIGSATQLWEFAGNDIGGTRPTNQAVAAAMAGVGANIYIEGNTVRLGHPETVIDLGGIAKGFAADLAAEFLREQGVAGIVNLSGDITTSGINPNGNLWSIGPNIPFTPMLQTATHFIIEIGEASSVTSGIDSRYFTMGGRYYHHIIDPQTGFPPYIALGPGSAPGMPILRSDTMVSATVVSPTSLFGEGFATAAFLLGADAVLELVETLPDVEIALGFMDLSVRHSSGFGQRDNLSITLFDFSEFFE